jgi:hypothetical protein
LFDVPDCEGEAAMANKGSTKDDSGSAGKAGAGHGATPDEASAATDREKREKRREPLHAFIVHFDAEPSSKPSVLDFPGEQA